MSIERKENFYELKEKAKELDVMILNLDKEFMITGNTQIKQTIAQAKEKREELFFKYGV